MTMTGLAALKFTDSVQQVASAFQVNKARGHRLAYRASCQGPGTTHGHDVQGPASDTGSKPEGQGPLQPEPCRQWFCTSDDGAVAFRQSEALTVQYAEAVTVTYESACQMGPVMRELCLKFPGPG